jgi:hypothetical protein
MGAVLALAIGAALAATADAALVGHWTLDDNAANTTVADSSGNARNGVFTVNTQARSVPAVDDRALDFQGSDWVNLDAHAAALGALTNFTLSSWVQYDGGPSKILFSWSDGTTGQRIQTEVTMDAVKLGWQSGGGWQTFGSTTPNWDTGNAWHHLAFVNDSTAGKKIYIDGALTDSDANTLGPAGLVSVTQVRIGDLISTYPYDGRIDDVQLDNTAIDDAGAIALANAHNIAFGKPVISDTIGYYDGGGGEDFPFDNLTDGRLNDSGSSGDWSFWLAPASATGEFVLDLEGWFAINYIDLQNTDNRDWSNAGTADFRIEVSLDDVNYTALINSTLTDVRGMSGFLPFNSFAFAPVDARYIKFFADSSYGTRKRGR